MRPFLISLAALVGVGALAGWLAAGGGVGAIGKDQTPWSLTDRPALGDAERLKVYAALMATNHFGAARIAADNGADDGDEDSTGPQIAGAAVIDGNITVSFHNAGENKLITAGVGDVLPGGWVIKDATLERVIVERNGDIREITVFPHDNPGI